jgi:ferredoxin-NADP reductase
MAGTEGAAAAGAWQEATIEQIVDETPTVKSFVLRPRAWRPFLPGQHVDVRLTAGDGYQARRSYSIASAPDVPGTLQLAVERLDHGEVSPFFHEVAVVGDAIELRHAPAEHFAWRPEPGGTVLLVGGGSGVAPLMSMVRHRAYVPGAGRMVLLYSARTWADVIFRDELLAQPGAQRGLDVVLCLTREPPRRPGDQPRRIDAEIIADVLGRFPAPPDVTFVCGANRFVGSVAELLVAQGLDAPSIRTERFGGT